jgi:hypothetical protein
MVNLRDRFTQAVAAGVISPALAADLTAIAKACFYGERSLHATIAAARRGGAAEESLARLQAWAAQAGPSLKARDAQAMLKTMAARAAVAPRPAAFTVERTVFLEALEREVRDGAGDPAAADGEGAPDGSSDRALLAILAQRELERFGLGVGARERRQAVETFRRRFALTATDELDRRLGAAGIELEAFVARVVDLAAIDKARRIHALEHARVASEHAALAALTAAAEKENHVD